MTQHASPDDIEGKHVIGVLPMRLAALACKVTEIALDLPPDMRGKELDVNPVREYATGARTISKGGLKAPVSRNAVN